MSSDVGRMVIHGVMERNGYDLGGREHPLDMQPSLDTMHSPTWQPP
jgi:hypothetical protein